VRQQVASAIDLIVQIGRLRDGSRKVMAITEVTGMEGEVLSTQDIFSFRATGTSPEGKVLGKLEPTGVAAKFYHQLKADGEAVDFGVFAAA
jgi:pilus assembly protein CpaF